MSVGADPLEGISEKSTKPELMERLNQIADKLRSAEKKRTGRLAEIEAKVRDKYRPGEVPELHNVIVSATLDEVKEAHAFLEEFADILPTPLARIRQGWKLLIEGPPKDEDED